MNLQEGHLEESVRAPLIIRRGNYESQDHRAYQYPNLRTARRAVARGAQRTGKVYRIGFLSAAGGRGQRFLKEGLVELGYYMEGQNIAIVNRFAFRKPELLPKLSAELVNLKVDVIVSGTLTAARCGPPQVQSQCQHPGWKF